MPRLTLQTAGESHGPLLTGLVTGLPAGLRIDVAALNGDLARRQHGYGRGGPMKIEQDEARFTGGLRGGETLGGPIAFEIANRDYGVWEKVMGPVEVDVEAAGKRKLTSPRPGHADLAGGLKYGRRDLRDILERASARESAARVAAGALRRRLLAAPRGRAKSRGVANAFRRGSAAHDPIAHDAARGFSRTSNRAGGLEGGITNGEDVLVTLYQKPISTLRDGLPSVDIETKLPHRAQYERSDVTAVPACGVIGEAMLAFVLADALLEKTGGDSMEEVTRNFEGFVKAQKQY